MTTFQSFSDFVAANPPVNASSRVIVQLDDLTKAALLSYLSDVNDVLTSQPSVTGPPGLCIVDEYE